MGEKKGGGGVDSRASISSSDLPLVSVMKNQTNATRAKLKTANMTKVRHPRFVTAWGVAWEKTKLKSHCVAVLMAMPASRMRVGKISPV